MSRYYILGKNHAVKACDDVIAWGRWWEEHQAECLIGQDFIGNVEVVTSFLGVDLNVLREVRRMMGVSAAELGPPTCFETAVFAAPARSDLHSIERCATWAAAKKQHARACREARRAASN